MSVEGTVFVQDESDEFHRRLHLVAMAAEKRGIPPLELLDNSRFLREFGIDSLEQAELSMHFEELIEDSRHGDEM